MTNDQKLSKLLDLATRITALEEIKIIFPEKSEEIIKRVGELRKELEAIKV